MRKEISKKIFLAISSKIKLDIVIVRIHVTHAGVIGQKHYKHEYHTVCKRELNDEMIQTTFGRFRLEEIKTDTPVLIIGDAISVMKELAIDSFDMILEDLPYPDLEAHRDVGTTTRMSISEGSNQEFYEIADYADTIPLYAKLLKRGKHLYQWRPSFNEESLKFWNQLINPDTGLLHQNRFTIRKIIPCYKNYQGMGYSYNSRHERIIDSTSDLEEIIFSHANGDMKKLNMPSIPDIFMDEWKHPRSNDRIHVSEKPISITKILIMNSTVAGQLILEPFAGSFPTGFANSFYGLGRRILGIEKDMKIANRTIEHFKKYDMPLDVQTFQT